MEAREVLRTFLSDPTNPEVAHRLIAPDAPDMSLNVGNPEFRRIMPWTGTRTGLEAVVDTFGTASTFRSGGVATYCSDPDGGEVTL